MKELKFSLKLKEVPVEITDVDGTKKSYKLREVAGDDRCIFLDDMSERMGIGEDGKPTIKKVRGLQESLLTKSLYDEKDKLVSEDVLKTYPSTVLTELFKTAQTLSGLDMVGVDEAKND